MAADLTPWAYLAGTAGLVAATAAAVLAAVSVRALLVPGWVGARARLAEAVVGLALVTAMAQALGSVGALSRGPVLVGVVGTGLAVAGGAHARGRSPRGTSEEKPGQLGRSARATRPLDAGLALVAVAVVAVQWVAHTAYTGRRGMNHADTLWYHMPFSARFLQTQGLGSLDGIGYEAARWFPLNSQLLHSLVVLPYDRDWLSPVLNLGWAALALLAAWVLGQARGAGPLAVAGAAAAMGLPVLAGSQPGQASTDIACAALLLAAVALLVEGDLDPRTVGLAGAAVGLALSTKVTLAVPIAVLVIAVAVLCLARRHPVALAAWLGAAAATGAFWFGRNWVLTGTPLPWFDLPLGLDRATTSSQADSLLEARQFDRATWDAVYRPGLRQALGPAWPLHALLPVAVGAALLARGRGWVARIVGFVLLAGVAGYLATPLTAGFSFVFNLRYLSPVVLVAAAALPLVLPASPRWRTAALAAVLAVVAVGATASNHERVSAWPAETWPVAGLAAIALLAVLGSRHPAVRGRVPGRAVAAAVLLVLAAIGLPAERASSVGRYQRGALPPTEVIATHLRDVRGSRVVVYGTEETYPMFGLDLSNDVRLGTPPPDGPGTSCERWRQHLNGHFDRLVVTRWGVAPPVPPPHEVLADDASVTVELRQDPHVVYRIDGPLDPAACP